MLKVVSNVFLYDNLRLKKLIIGKGWCTKRSYSKGYDIKNLGTFLLYDPMMKNRFYDVHLIWKKLLF